MHMFSKLLAGATAIAATVSLGLAGTAQAQITGAHHGVRPLSAKPSTVPAGVVTSVKVSNPCPSGTAPSSVTGFPAPDGSTTNLQTQQPLPKAPTAIQIAGVWSPAGSYTVTVSCPGGQSGNSTVTVQSSPADSSVVASGSDTIQNVMDQFSADYNSKPPAGSAGNLYSWDATNPITGAMGDSITPKAGCTAIPRPDGSSAGITALENRQAISGGTGFCLDFARSSRARTTPPDPTSITFITLAGDALSYATQPGSHAPGNLTTSDLTGIYNCTITKWNQIPGNSGGSTNTIAAMLPQSGSGTRSFFLTAIGLTAPGACVSTSATRQGAAGNGDNTLQENEGVAASLNTNKKNVIFPYSVGKYLAERYHSATCFTTGTCAPDSHGLVCAPKVGKNLFGCNTHGTMGLNMINSTDPTTPWPLTDSTTNATINPAFTATFERFLFEVVDSPEFTIPSYLQPYFGPTGWVCTSSAAHTDLINYGFLPLTAGTAAGDCGSLS